MPRTLEEEAEYQALGQQLGVFPSPAPQPQDQSLPARFGQDVANIPSDIGQTFVSGARNLLNINQPPELQLAPWNVPRPYDVAPATSLGQRLTDLGPSLAGSLAAAAIPGSAVSKLGVLAGAADFAPIMGDVAGGLLTGASQSADNAVPEGATFGMLGLANRIPNPWLRMAANAAIPVGDQLLHGQSPTDQQSLINTGTGIALAALLGGHAQPQDGAPLLTPSAPDDSTAQPPRSLLQLMAPPQQLILNAPPQPGEVRGGVVYAQPSTTDLSPDRSFTTPGYVPPGTGDVAPLPTGLPAPRTLADAAYAGDIVTFNGLLGEVQQGPDGYYVSGDDGTQRLFGNVPNQPLHQIEGLVPEITGDRAPDVEPPFNPNQTVPHTDSILDPSITSASAGTGPDDLDARMAEREQATDIDDHHQAVSDAVDSVVGQYPDADVQVHQTFDDIPDEDLKARAMAQDPNLVNAEGFNDPATGTQHIISENVADADRAREVAVHEVVGHYGVDQIIDPQDWQGIQDHVLSRGGALADSISQLYHGKDIGDLNDAERNRVTREYVAQVAENTNLDPTLWQKVTAAVRKALRAAGINRDWSDAEIQDLVRKAHKSLKEGGNSFTASNARVTQRGNGQIGGGGDPSLTAHHGTPHKVDKFSLDKVGSGEGNQTYGHGLYFAENPDTAQFYKDNTSALLHHIEYGGTKLSDIRNPAQREAIAEVARYGKSEAEQRAQREIDSTSKESGYQRDLKQRLAAVRGVDEGKISKSGGNAYTVRLDADPDELLDWDKPLSEQSEQVQKAYLSALSKKSGKEVTPEWVANFGNSGEQMHALASAWNEYNPRKTSEMLKEAGIPGIRYLDQGSRTTDPDVRWSQRLKRNGVPQERAVKMLRDANRLISQEDAQAAVEKAYGEPEGTHNYVMFDDSRIQITHENGNEISVQQALDPSLRRSTDDDAARSKGTPSTIPQEPLRTSADDQQEQAVKQAYGRLAERTGFPSVAISDLATESRQPLEAVKSLLTRSHQDGKALLSQGDWSTASPEKRLGAIEANNGYGGPAKNLLVRMLPDVDSAKRTGSDSLAAAPVHPTDTPEFKKWFGSSKVVDASGNPMVVGHGGGEPIKDFSRGAKRGQIGLAYFSDSKSAPWHYALNGGINPEYNLAEQRRIQLKYDPQRTPTVTKAFLKIENPLDARLDDVSLEKSVASIGSEKVMRFLSKESPSTYDKIEDQYESETGNPRDEASYSDVGKWALENPDVLHEAASEWHVENDADSLKDRPNLKFLAGAIDPRTGRSLLHDYMDSEGHDGVIYKDAEAGSNTYVVRRPEQIKSAANNGEFDLGNPNIDASLPSRLDDAARGQQEDQPSALGKFSRYLETDFGMSKTDQTKLAEEKGIGVQSSLIGKVNDAADAYRKDKPLLTPAQDTAARLFQQTDTTPASVAALKAASLPKTAEDLLVAAADVKTKGQATIAAAETPEHAAVINKSEGYQRRAYQIFTDPKTWIKRLGRGDYSKQIDDAAAWAKSRPEFAGADPATIRRAVSMFASDIANGRDFTMGGDSQKISQSLYLTKKDLTPQQWRTMETLRGDSRLSPSEQDTVKGIVRDQHLKPSDQKFMDVLSRRGGFSPDEAATLKAIGQQETVAPQIRALFGEHTDPIEQAMYTAQKITGSVRQAETIKQIAESSYPDGRKLAYKDSAEYQQALNGATGDAKRALLRYKQLPKSDGFGVLAGRWADVGVGDTINAMNQGAADGGNAFLAKLQKVMKLNATVLNPAAHFHWWMQMPLMMSMARVYNPAQWLEAGKIVLGSDASRNAVRDELIRNGILDGGASNEFTGNARSISNIREPETTLGKIKMGGDKAIQYLGQLYGHPDEIIRSAAYLSAKAKALASGLSEQKAQDRAITFTNKYTFNYKAVPMAVANASNIPGLNPFLRYSSELTRITKNLAQDVISGTGEDRTHGALNLALMAAVPLAASLGSSSTNLSPEDQADWDRLRKLEPPDMRGQIKFVLGRKKDGTFNYFDISPLLPAGDTFNIAKDVLKGDWKAFAEDQPLVGLSHSPIASLGIDLSTGTNSSTGQKMFTAGDYASRIAQPLLPPVLGSQLQHDIRSFSANAQGGTGLTNPRTGREDTPVTSLLGHVGLRLNSENTSVLMRSALSDANDEKAAASQILRQTAATNAAPAAQQKALLQYQGRLADINKSLLARIQP